MSTTTAFVAQSTQRPRILVVEDEALISLMCERMLEAMGYACVPIYSFESALSAIQTGKFDAAILDINLHGESARPIAEALDRLKVPFGFATGYPRTRVDERWRDRPYVSKPYATDEFEAFVSKLLQNAKTNSHMAA